MEQAKHYHGQGEDFRRILARGGGIKRLFQFYLRRIFSKTQDMSAGYHTTGPITFLATASAVGLAMTITTLYTVSYTVTVDGEVLAVVLDQAVVEQAVTQVTAQGQSIIGDDYEVESNISYQMGLNLKSKLSDSSMVEHYLYGQLDDIGSALLRYQVTLEGKPVAILEKESDLDKVLDNILNVYRTEDTLTAEFVEDIRLENVYQGDYTSLTDLEAMLTENTTGETTYTVAAGDTFNAIAYSNNMSTAELMTLNPEVDPNRLFIGDVVSVKEIIPLLSVVTTSEEQYVQSIPCPVEQINDSTIYVGASKVVSQGVTGEEEVHAKVEYLNGREVERQVISSTVLREPTATVTAIGTMERPVSASYGSYIWPTSGRISSYFGGRQLYGSYDYHSGLDIAAPYGTAVLAADGGTITFSGWRSSYGNLVIITHDNGAQTYYAHNSSLLVSVGQKVYRGQTIAKVGSTGNSTGNHLHFEVRIGGKAVNPLSYLP